MQAFEVLSVLGGVEASAVQAGAFAAIKGVEIAVPLNRLFISKFNVRKVRNAVSIPELAEQIAAESLLNRLDVVAEENRKGATGRFGVVAGGRRLAALQHLAENGRLALDALIDCKLFDSARAVAVSLTENAGQEAMHPADMAEAFKALVDEGKTVAQIAGRFGVSELTVERRLKIANLAPQFLQLYREGKIDPKQLQALALTADPAKQIAAWESLSPGSRSAYHLTQVLTESELQITSTLAAFVGLEAYEAAGGAVRRDLFGGDNDVFLQDAALVQTLTKQRLEREAEAVRSAGWKWVEVHQDYVGYDTQARYGRLYAKTRKPTDAEREGFALVENMVRALRVEHNTLMDSVDDESEFTDEQSARETELDDQIESLLDLQSAMNAALVEWSRKQLAEAGAIVSIDHDGDLRVMEGLIRPEDRKAVASAGIGAVGARGEPLEKAKPAFSERLLQSLTAHRTAAVAAALTDNPHVAMVALLHRLILSEGGSRLKSPVCISLTDSGERVGNLATDFATTPAARTLDAARERWGAKLPAEPAALFRYLLAQNAGTLAELLALHVARSFDVIEGRESGRRGFNVADAIVDALDVDMADWWTASPAHYLESVPKAKVIEAVTEACGEAEARDLAKMKKPEAVAAAAAKLDGKRWLPAPLRRVAVVEVADADSDADSESDTE